jgi:DNA-directed RNA polymerase specialized sigma24 family protein
MCQVKPDSTETAHLLEQAQGGDSSAFDRLFQRYRPELCRMIELRLDEKLRSRMDPSDVVQEAQLEAFRRLADFLDRQPMPFWLWLRKTACERLLNLRRDHLRAARREVDREVPLARRIVVDHRTDVYSLGVTLYELLTLQPAFTGRDRQRLLSQIALEEPRRPRRLNKSVPAELEIIILKAMAKDRAERYETAQELADDLERFLEHKPIQARRPTLVQRMAKWSRRHPAVVVSGAAAAVLVLLTITIGALVVAEKEREKRAAAVEARNREAELRQRAEKAERDPLRRFRRGHGQHEQVRPQFGQQDALADARLPAALTVCRPSSHLLMGLARSCAALQITTQSSDKAGAGDGTIHIARDQWTRTVHAQVKSEDGKWGRKR